eukprot:6179515-Pleurochrysis_carterae.AAC.3
MQNEAGKLMVIGVGMVSHRISLSSRINAHSAPCDGESESRGSFSTAFANRMLYVFAFEVELGSRNEYMQTVYSGHCATESYESTRILRLSFVFNQRFQTKKKPLIEGVFLDLVERRVEDSDLHKQGDRKVLEVSEGRAYATNMLLGRDNTDLAFMSTTVKGHMRHKQ